MSDVFNTLYGFITAVNCDTALEMVLTQTKTMHGLERIPYNASNKAKYKTKDNMLIHAQDGDNITGCMFIDKKTNAVKAYIIINRDTDYIVGLWVDPGYRQKGISQSLLNIAQNSYNAQFLSVNKKNTIAIAAYKKNKWREFKSSDTMIHMTNLSEDHLKEVMVMKKD